MADYDNNSGKKFWGDIGAGILPFCTTTKRFLLNLRSSAVNEPNTYGIWGGKLDDGENNPEEAAIRELEEETKYNGNIILKALCVYKTEGFEYYNYLGFVNREFIPDVSDCWESDDYKWVSLEEMENMNNLHFGVEYILDNCFSKLDTLIEESLIIRFNDFIVEKDNLEKSYKGLSKFGMNDTTKFPHDIENYIKENGFEKISSDYAGFDNAVEDQIYHKIIKDYEDNELFELSFFIYDDESNDLAYSLYSNIYNADLCVYFKWNDYKKFLDFLNDYSLEIFGSIVSKNQDSSTIYNNIKESIEKYDLSDFNIST